MRVRFRIDSTTGGPMLRFGTKWPSITSTWSWSGAAGSMRAMASPRAAKSAARMLGAILITARRYHMGGERAPLPPMPPIAHTGLRARGEGPAQPDRREPVGAVPVRQEVDE